MLAVNRDISAELFSGGGFRILQRVQQTWSYCQSLWMKKCCQAAISWDLTPSMN